MTGPAARHGRDETAAGAALRDRLAGLVPDWAGAPGDPGSALVAAAAHYLTAIGRRLDRAPEIGRSVFLETLGVRPVPARAARAPVVVALEPGAPDQRMPAGTRLAAAAPPGTEGQVSYETERAVALAGAAIRDVVSVWPGRDQYTDHGADHADGTAFTPFARAGLVDQPHLLYLAHDRLFALAGSARVSVEIDLAVPGSAPLDLRWEYFDGTAWRPFAGMAPGCAGETPDTTDGTAGLTRGGVVRLESDGATTAPTTVGGHTGLWVRARVAGPLPPDPHRVLPEISGIRIGSGLDQRFSAPWRVRLEPARPDDLLPRGDVVPGTRPVLLVARDTAGLDLAVGVRAAPGEPPLYTEGQHQWLSLPAGGATVVVVLDGVEQRVWVPARTRPARLTVTLDLARPDRATAGGAALDLTAPFRPFGPSPEPGAVLFLGHPAFGVPGASVRVFVQPVPGDAGTEQHAVSWEYWNGRDWVSLVVETSRDAPLPGLLTGTGFVPFTLPDDVVPATVGGTEGPWLRVRLLRGAYGRRTEIPVGPPVAAGGTQPTVPVFTPRPPLLADLRLGWTREDGPVPPERVVTANDFTETDRTPVATTPGGSFAPFHTPADPTPALYLGLDRPLPVDDIGLYLGAVESPQPRPPLRWEYWNGTAWARLRVTDDTDHLRVPGIVSFAGPPDLAALARFGTPRFWLRARLGEDGPPGEPTLAAVHLNAVPVEQRETVVDELLGSGTGEPTRVLRLRRVPVLPGQEIEVRELSGARADVEWRTVAAEVLADPDAVRELTGALAASGAGPELRRGSLRLLRDHLGRVVEVWVRWAEVPDLDDAAPGGRCYAVHRARGLVLFGGAGRVLPAGAAVRAAVYRSGGGSAGNAAAGAISQILGPLGAVETVRNPLPAGGGADAETADRIAVRGPATVRHRGRAVTARDYETMACEASSAVAAARAVADRDAAGRPAPGRVTVVVVPQGPEERPYPPAGLRETVHRYLAGRAPAGLACSGRLVVTGPEYTGVDVRATLVTVEPGTVGAVEQAARAAVATFLHPLRGGRDGRGRAPGQDVYLSDLASVLERTPGVDLARDVALTLDGVEQGAVFPVPPHRLAAAGAVRLTVLGPGE